MFRFAALLVFGAVLPSAAATVQPLLTLPNSPTITAMQLDSAGNAYLVGSFVPASKNFTSAFIAKVSADGAHLLYFTPLAGSSNNVATSVAVASDGSAYVAGTTFSLDFPVTSGALYPTVSGFQNGFLAKVNTGGAVISSTYIAGTGSTQTTGMTLDATGDVFLTGTGGPAFTPPNTSPNPALGFVLALTSDLSRVLLSSYGVGGGLISVDAQGNIFLAGTADPALISGSLALPTLSAGGFQPTQKANFCITFGSGPGGPGGSLACRYQYVAKLKPDGTNLWSTYVSGSHGAIPSGIAVDPTGNVIVAGTTLSDDYPTTPGAFQTVYTAGAPPISGAPNGFKPSPSATGYVTKVNANGTALLWSTYFGGSYPDSVTGLAVAPSGALFIAGHAFSSDLPALAGTSSACAPTANQMLAFIGRLAPDGATAGPTQLITGIPDCLYFSCFQFLYSDYPNYLANGPLAITSGGKILFASSSGRLESVDVAATHRLDCIDDPSDYAQVNTVAPGQLLALFGANLAPAAPFIPPGGVAQSTAALGVFFNGIPAPILYSAAGQINVQVPFEIAGQSTVQMQLTSQQTSVPFTESTTLAVQDRAPSVFLSAAAETSLFPGYTVCGGVMVLGASALAVNGDGTLNDCHNPAAAGTTVTLVLDGMGVTTPALSTGTIAAAPAVTLTPAVVVADPNFATLLSTTATLPGAITGATQLRVTLPKALTGGPYNIGPSLNGTALRERSIIIWTRSN